MPDNSTPLFPQVEYRGIAGYPGYRVGDDGSVWSCWKRAGRGKYVLSETWIQMAYGVQERGYHHLSLRASGKKKNFLIHRLVLEAFVGKCPPGLECRHWDGVHGNNRLDNLSWGSHQDNMEDQVRHGTRVKGTRQGLAKLTEAEVLEIVAMSTAGKTGIFIASYFGIVKSNVYAILRGRIWAHVTGLPRT